MVFGDCHIIAAMTQSLTVSWEASQGESLAHRGRVESVEGIPSPLLEGLRIGLARVAYGLVGVRVSCTSPSALF